MTHALTVLTLEREKIKNNENDEKHVQISSDRTALLFRSALLVPSTYDSTFHLDSTRILLEKR